LANISLKCHEATPPFMTDSIDVHWDVQQTGKLWLRFHVECDLGFIELPDPFEEPFRADDLWQTTCFEMFLREADASEYLEFNFSPSRNWAAYRFDDYRTGMREWPMTAPEIYLDMSDTHLALEVTIDLPGLITAHTRAGLSSVIHESGDIKSYWALKLPPGDPDFHHKDCFALKLAPPEAA
jgi:hypothetical protein